MAKPVEVTIKDLKALFFVKDYQGDPHRVKTNQFDFEKKVIGQKIKIVFLDGEVLTGTTTGYQSGRKGFFIVPADPNSNNERCYIVTASTKEITFL